MNYSLLAYTDRKVYLLIFRHFWKMRSLTDLLQSCHSEVALGPTIRSSYMQMEKKEVLFSLVFFFFFWAGAMIISSLLLILSILILTPNYTHNCIQDFILTHFPFQPKDYYRQIWLNRGTFTHYSSSLTKTTLKLKKTQYMPVKSMHVS